MQCFFEILISLLYKCHETYIDTFKRLLNSEGLYCNEDIIKPVFVLHFRFFDSIDICKYRSDWMESRLHGVLPSNCEGQSLFVTHVEVFETAEVELCLFQGGTRYAVHLGSKIFHERSVCTLPHDLIQRSIQHRWDLDLLCRGAYK